MAKEKDWQAGIFLVNNVGKLFGVSDDSVPAILASKSRLIHSYGSFPVTAVVVGVDYVAGSIEEFSWTFIA